MDNEISGLYSLTRYVKRQQKASHLASLKSETAVSMTQVTSRRPKSFLSEPLVWSMSASPALTSSEALLHLNTQSSGGGSSG